MKRLFIKIFESRYPRRVMLMGFDLMCYLAMTAFFFVIARRAANSMPVYKLGVFLLNAAVQLVAVFATRWMMKVYRNVWRYSNTRAYFNLVVADTLGGLLTLLAMRIINLWAPGAYYGVWHAVAVGALTNLMVLMSRFCYSLVYKSVSKAKDTKPRVPVAIVGAGRLGSYLAGDLRNNPNSGYEPMFFIDNDEVKINNLVSGLKVYNQDTATQLIEKLGIREVVVAIATKESEALAELYFYYKSLGCRVRMYDSLVSKKQAGGVLREFSIEDLLFRKSLVINGEETLSHYRGKVVLVTGGGGSIGSEISRQIAKCQPKKLVIFDIYENNAYDIQQELILTYGSQLDLAVEIGSVRDPQRLEELFAAYKPDIVFHAAAHKHVPLMEHSSKEAIKNNCMGTYYTANAAEKHGVEKFVLISTDKAVNPTNIMGASKRVCEMVIQCRTNSRTSFAAVRFGNVLGSNGSVIHLFKKQIAEGGPVTLTDKRIIRYFMTIPEASQLVIQAGAMARSGELFVLDMGKPVRIYDLAVNMIQLSGLKPDEDIEIKEIGLRPGEKLYEELLMKTEKLDKTENNMIFIERDTPYSREEVEEKLALLMTAVEEGGNVKEAFAQVVPTYQDPDVVNRAAESSAEMQAVG